MPPQIETVSHNEYLATDVQAMVSELETYQKLVTRFDEVQSGTLPPDSSKFPLTWIAQQITGEQRDFLAGFEGTIVLPVDGLGDVLFCHATPRSDEEIFFRDYTRCAAAGDIFRNRAANRRFRAYAYAV